MRGLIERRISTGLGPGAILCVSFRDWAGTAAIKSGRSSGLKARTSICCPSRKGSTAEYPIAFDI